MRQGSPRIAAGQFGGLAMYSIIAGGASIALPIGSAIATNGAHSFVFILLPFFGLWRGVLAIMRGQVVGGLIGIGLSAIGALLTFF